MKGTTGLMVLMLVATVAGWAGCGERSSGEKLDVFDLDQIAGDGLTQDTGEDGLSRDLVGDGVGDLGDGGVVDVDEGGDLGEDGAMGDGAADIAEIEFTPLPVEPPKLPTEQALPDPVYEQEFNHTWNEMEPEVGELVGLVKPPDGYDLWDLPTLVAPDGVLIRPEADVLVAIPLPEGEPGPLLASAATSEWVYVASEMGVYRILPDGGSTLVGALPEGATLRKLSGSAQHLDVVTTQGWGVVAGGGLLEWVSSKSDIGAVLRTVDGLVLAQEGILTGFADPAIPLGTPTWTVELDVGMPVAIMANRTLPSPLDFVVVGDAGVAGIVKAGAGMAGTSVPLFEPGMLPLPKARSAIPTPDGGFAVAAFGGAYRFVEPDAGPEYRVYAAQRWMPSGNVRDILAPEGATGTLYFATDHGVGYVTSTEWTVEEKMAPMAERIVLRHDRDGAIADSHMMTPGDLSTNIPWDSDNDGGWTCYWVLSECFRYKVTGDPEAKAHFDKSLDRMLSLRTLTGTDYFLARSVIRIDGCQLDDCDAPGDGEWFKSPDQEWWVKADTSNDEVTSHMFMMGLAHDVCASDAQKAAIVAHVDGIVGGLVDNGYRLIDPQDGLPTKFGQFDPTYVNWWVEGTWGDGGRRSAQILGAINLAHFLTGKQKYQDARNELLKENHYAENVDNLGNAEIYPFCAGSGDCDELAMQAFYTLIRYERDPVMRARWQAAWSQLYESLYTQEDALWDLSNLFFGGEMVDLSRVIRWFQSYPTDLIRFVMHNDERQDWKPAPDYYLTKDKKADFTVRSDGHIFPSDERPNDRHNTSQFALHGGVGAQVEMESADVLFAYWMGRYYGYIRGTE